MGSWSLNIEANELKWSDEIFRIFGLKPKQFEATYDAFLSTVHPDDKEYVDSTYRNATRNKTPYDIVHRIVRPDGEIRYVREKAENMVDEKGSTFQSIGIVHDITKSKLAELRIINDLKEKETLLKEIHHRVKNNLQVISSLLNLQSQSITDKASLRAFEESQNRIHSLALVHEELYNSNNLAKIDLKGYIDKSVYYLYQQYSPYSEKIVLDLDLESVSLGIDYALPCGLIINEVVSNSLKHAFPSGWSGTRKLSVYLRKIGNAEIELNINDNGVGFPKDFAIHNVESFGMHMIYLLGENQLGGKVRFNGRRGTSFQLNFKLPETERSSTVDNDF